VQVLRPSTWRKTYNDISNVNSVEELLSLWRSYGYTAECVVVHTGKESVYYIGVDDDKCSFSLCIALQELADKLNRYLAYHVEYPEEFAEVRSMVMQIS